MDWSSHCLVTLPFFFFPSFSWDICFVTSWQWRQLLWKTHKGAGTVNTAHPDNYGFSPNDCNFQGDNANRQRRSGTKACATSSLKFRITNEVTWGWWTKWQKKHCWAGMSAYCHHDTTREAGEAFCLFCEVNTLCKNWGQFKGRGLFLCRQSI